MVTKLTLEYDGSDFAGWARQPGLRSVQEELERAIARILGQELATTVAGRTDRGVHARGQVVSYQAEALDPTRLNGLLGKDVAVLASEPVGASFDARGDAISRTYCYRIFNRRERSAFEARYSLWEPRALDREALHECARRLRGVHDFTAFTPTETQHQRFRREVISAEWCEDGDLFEFWIEGASFVRHMNRVLIGTMLEVGLGKRSLEEFTELLEGRPRSHAGPTAPAHGLHMVSVRY